MSCQETRQLLDAYVDGELDLVRSLELERHLESCAECHPTALQLKEARAAVQTYSPYFTAPQILKRGSAPSFARPPRGCPKLSLTINC